MTRELPVLHIASPCPVAWADMPGDDRVRHCSRCDHPVYNLSDLTSAEVTELFAGETVPCVRLYQRADGTFLTRDCPAGRALRVRRATRRAVVALASWFGIVLAVGCHRESDCVRTQGKPSPELLKKGLPTEPEPND